MDTRHELLCVWTIYPMIILFGIGLVLFAGFIPPLAPSASAEDIAAIYRSRPNMILAGQAMFMAAAVLLLPFFAAIGFQMARIEGRRPILAVTQMLIGVGTALLTVIPATFFAIAAFRPERDAGFILLMNDLGFMFFLWEFAPAFFQNIVIAICVLSDKSPQPLFPRWVAFLNIWVALLYLPGALIPFFKTGPFAWNGLLAFWIPVNAFFVWMIAMAFVVTKAIKRPEPVA